MSSPQVALILGTGPRIRLAVAHHFARAGYKVAVVSRSVQPLPAELLHIKADLSQPDIVPSLFAEVRSKLGASPAVVVYNAAALTVPPEGGSVFDVTAEQVTNDLNVNTVTPWVVGQEAVKGWKELGDVKKSFIYTGNGTNVAILWPGSLTLGMGKSASAYWVGIADGVARGLGGRFYYADERKSDGSIGGAGIDGDAHAEFYGQLAKHEHDVPWHATFVKGKGYSKF